MEKHLGQAPEASFPPVAKKAYGKVTLTESADLFSNLDHLARPVFSPYPSNMEALGQDYGFILYRTYIEGPVEEQPLLIREVHDRAMVFLDGEYKGPSSGMKKLLKSKWGPGRAPRPSGHSGGKYGKNQLRSLAGRPQGHHRPRGAEHSFPVSSDFIWLGNILPAAAGSLRSCLSAGKEQMPNKPAFQRGSFVVQECAATFVDMSGFTKGNVFYQRKNIGRYWEKRAPEDALCAGMLPQGRRNSIVVFELHAGKPSLEFKDQPDLG